MSNFNNIIYRTIFLLIICSLVGCTNNTVKSPWYFDRLHVSNSWKISKGLNETIAFIDTGISPELSIKYADRIVSPYNVLTNSPVVIDENGHGTEMITAACGEDIEEISGIAPSARIMPIVAVGKDGHTNENDLAKGINWAIAQGATVINLSIGSMVSNPIVVTSIQNALKKHIIVVAAAGDYGDKGLLFPASLKEVISVVAQGEDGNDLSMSNYSENATISIPGSNIPVLTIGEDGHLIHGKVNGTSVATAITSGIIALALSKNLSLTPTILGNDMKKSLDKKHFLDVSRFLKLTESEV